MNRFKSLLNKTPLGGLGPKTPAVVETPNVEDLKKQKKYSHYTKTGPQLMITKILMIHGSLQNKQVWRIYSRMLKQNSKLENPQTIDCFDSLTQMKKVIQTMKGKQKLKSSGYNKKIKEHLGWKIQTKKALKYVHPQAIQKIQQSIKSKDLL